MNHISVAEVEKLLENKWKQFKLLHEGGRPSEKSFSRHAMLTVRSIERDLKEHVKKKGG